MTKSCRRCDKTKDINEFHRHAQMRDGRLNICRACRSEQDAEYRARNKEKLKLRSADYRARNADRIREGQARYRAKNVARRKEYDAARYARDSAKFLAYQADYYTRNSASKLEYAADYRAGNRERLRAWHAEYRAKNPDLMRRRDVLRAAVRRTKTTGALVVQQFTTEQLQDKLRYWNECCWVCGDPATAIDHVKPLSAGGGHLLANLRPICKVCNSAKNGRWPLPSRAQIMGLVG
jgi:5-methylcytosine-specific restriction endonuclease McrA